MSSQGKRGYLPDLYVSLFESRDAFHQACPWCGEPLSDRTGVEKDAGMLFYRVRFTCHACDYWLCTRMENFAVLGPVPRKGEPTPAYLAPADPADPSLSDSESANRLNAGRVLANLAIVYEQEGRQEEAQALLAEAHSWAPELFGSS